MLQAMINQASSTDKSWTGQKIHNMPAAGPSLVLVGVIFVVAA